MQLPPNFGQSRKKQVRRAKAALTAASFVVLPATSAFLAGFGTAHAVGGPGAVSGSVYLDANRNSTQDGGEAGVDGITATAYTTVGGVDTQIGSPVTTAGGGLYNINLSNVSAGDFIKVVFTNLGANSAVSIGGTTQTATLATGSSGGVFTGIANLGVAPATGVAIGDRVWIDTDGNGVQNANEGAVPAQLTGISVDLLEEGVVVASTSTDGNGYYLFVDAASALSGPGIKAYAGFTPGKKYTVRVNGVSATNTALSGYTNTLTNVGGADTDSDGVFCGTVAGSGIGPSATTCDPVSAEIILPTGAYSNLTIDFGFVPYDLEIAQVTNTSNVVAGGTASFVVTVTNKGPGPVQGCQIVNLLPAGLSYASPAITGATNVLSAGIDPTNASVLRLDCTRALAVNEQAIFTVNAIVGALVSGPLKNFSYVTPPSTDAAAAETKPLGNPIPTNATDANATTTLNDSQASVTVTAPAPNASLGDKVWFDDNNNGVQDTGELPAANISAELYDATGTGAVGPKTTTDNTGSYTFTGLNAGTYTVKFGTKPGYGYTIQNATAGNDTNDSDVNTTSGISDAVTVAQDENNPTVDAGLVLLAGGTTASIGDTAWIDSNSDGIQNAGELGYANLTVTLYNAAGGQVDRTTTNAQGQYLFSNLAAGNYSVTFSPALNYNFTTANAGTDRAIDSDADPVSGRTATFPLIDGQALRTVDAGLVTPSNNTSTTSTTVTTATNAATTTTAKPATTTTAVPGTLPPGSVVTFLTPTSSTVAPASSSTSTSVVSSSSSAPVTTTTPVSPATTVATSPGSPVILDATCKINSVVWNDTNGNGLIDAGEQIMAGVTVRVTAGGIVKEAVTDSQGRYSFVGVQCGDVTVQIVSGLPAGTPLPAPKTIRVLGETAQAPLDVPFGVQLQTDAEVAFGGAESRQFFAAALTFLGMGGLLVSRKRKEAGLRR